MKLKGNKTSLLIALVLIAIGVTVASIFMLSCSRQESKQINGKQAEKLLKSAFPRAAVLRISWADTFTLMGDGQAWDILTGNPITGNEPVTNNYINDEYVCGDYAKDSIRLIRDHVPNAAVFYISVSQHAMVVQIVQGRGGNPEVRLIEPQNPNVTIYLGDYSDRVCMITNIE